MVDLFLDILSVLTDDEIETIAEHIETQRIAHTKIACEELRKMRDKCGLGRNEVNASEYIQNRLKNTEFGKLKQIYSTICSRLYQDCKSYPKFQNLISDSENTQHIN